MCMNTVSLSRVLGLLVTGRRSGNARVDDNQKNEVTIMTYNSPELLTVGAAKTLVLGGNQHPIKTRGGREYMPVDLDPPTTYSLTELEDSW